MKFQALRPATLLKRYSSTGVFCEFCEIFKNVYFVEHLLTAASELDRYQVYTVMFEVRLEEEEESKNYLRITSEYLDELFELLKDDVRKKLQI